MSRRKRQRLMVRNFHENGMKFLLEHPGNVRELLQLLGIKQEPRIDFGQMSVVPGRYVGRDYRHLESDLVLQAPIRPPQGSKHRNIIVYILIEHQSEPDLFMPLRVLEYVVLIYKRQMREWEMNHGNLDKLVLQPVLPIVLYTGTRSWDKLGNLYELIDLGEELKEWIPQLHPIFLNVSEASQQQLAQAGVFGKLLKLVQQRRVRKSVFEALLGEVVPVLESLADKEHNRWLELLSYVDALIYNEREVQEREALIEKVVDSVKNDVYRKEAFQMGKTIAQDLIEQGEKKGLEKGRQKGLQEGQLLERQQMLLRLLKNRFVNVPEAIVKQIEATKRTELLQAWFDQASNALKLEEVAFKAK